MTYTAWEPAADSTGARRRAEFGVVCIELAAGIFGTPARHTVLKRWQLDLAGPFNRRLRDEADNLFISDKFKQRFPDFSVTSCRQGLCAIGAARPAN